MHEARPEEWVVGDHPDLAIVLAHGRGGSPADMRNLAAGFGLDNVRFVFLKADEGTWYPKPFMSPFADNEPWLSAALAHYDRAVSRLLAGGVPETGIVVGGFSQGACLTSEYLARHPRHYAGAIILTGGLIGPAGTRWPVRSELVGMPVYYSSSEIDEWIPVA
ncbi:MAG: phospholipase, partial [Cucumibacter sp.]